MEPINPDQPGSPWAPPTVGSAIPSSTDDPPLDRAGLATLGTPREPNRYRRSRWVAAGAAVVGTVAVTGAIALAASDKSSDDHGQSVTQQDDATSSRVATDDGFGQERPEFGGGPGSFGTPPNFNGPQSPAGNGSTGNAVPAMPSGGPSGSSHGS